MLPYKKKKKSSGSPAWMTTFSDLTTLLLVFFVLMYSFSVIDVQKFKRFVASFQGVGILDSGAEPLDKDRDHDYDVPSNSENTLDDMSKLQPLDNLYQSVQKYIQENNLESEISVRFMDKGVYLEIKDKIFFESGKADIKPESRKLLSDLSGLFKDIPNMISVEGHTDIRPIRSSVFPSNWELSTARAVSVVRYLSEQTGLNPARFNAAGYGEYQPVVPNDSPQNMAKNRRVVIVINTANTYSGKEVEINAARRE
ncbi:chemotaxis protein MotB [Desulfonispora thiosulfatigenes DSM 11270]|uniref:Chemotaxis protein MotB n=1 Tax=Desulfonispora thiosulfatigenes DSM 11270 TaxID=656914 RepID=A0A1W1UN34_DESTI|nr:OmpA family protein [Desulfonispora thiosulfatigenes]SMB82399.1 chemotaxis protein MotB [Desulfonispora thiosulfatigenes DSM 11270]